MYTWVMGLDNDKTSFLFGKNPSTYFTFQKCTVTLITNIWNKPCLGVGGLNLLKIFLATFYDHALAGKNTAKVIHMWFCPFIFHGCLKKEKSDTSNNFNVSVTIDVSMYPFKARRAMKTTWSIEKMGKSLRIFQKYNWWFLVRDKNESVCGKPAYFHRHNPDVN